MNKHILVYSIVLLLLLLSACSDKDEGNTEEQEDTKKQEQIEEETNEAETETDNEKSEKEEIERNVTLEDVDPIPVDVEGLASQLPGSFRESENLYNQEPEIEEAMKDLGPMSDNPTEEEYELYLRQMYWLVAKDYTNPEDTIKKWEFASFGNPDLPDSRFHFKENYNIEIILDSSGSMANYVGDQTRMALAKKAINDFLAKVPEEANVSLRVYGHKGTGSNSDKELSCNAIEQVYGFSAYDETQFHEALNQFKPSGWTPLADALKQSQEALKPYNSSDNTNLIYVVSDGVETCDGDPVAVAESLSQSNAKPIINIIGFQTDAEAQKQLEEMAEITGGIFASARNEEELQSEFERAEKVLEAWNKWKEDAMYEIDVQRVENSFDILAVNNDWYFATLKTDNQLNSFSNVLQNIEYITHEQKKKLKSKIDKTMAEIYETVEQLEKDMEEISQKTLEEARKMIEEKYDSQTESNS
ncbi:VWA domain-containing protein [Tenuibacillus multivorans]|uniref:Ca-activated chloride channel family protein n=1 Tax=Tenuibacillus multivorans TaxID=237069 RepID=A0A1G9WHI3_9BACI|nr:VWA domain-containing protein [Tenuibacillus multivorans]GEL76468.1 hypothetical protein TMU01_07030 [Tenuibacillus multivorans]SDM83998.1 Ca-activated chloride channel family protein [Tenuibacillus multivorans]